MQEISDGPSIPLSTVDGSVATSTPCYVHVVKSRLYQGMLYQFLSMGREWAMTSCKLSIVQRCAVALAEDIL